MMVTFVSQCEKKALSRTRRVLDAFADRIGSNTWQTVITEDGLAAVKKLLRKTASKNTAVACHWIRSRSRSELVWVVGNRRAFNERGVVPVNTTQRKDIHNEWENDWHYLPIIKALVAVAALLHDWGKATLLFQTKLKKSTPLGDPLRHEWISCLLLNALVKQSGDHQNDTAWLNLLVSGDFDETKLIKTVGENVANPLDQLPPMAQLLAWLIVTHHRLPSFQDKDRYGDESRDSITAVLKSISAKWGYQNQYDEKDAAKRLADCFKFPDGLLSQSPMWLKSVKKWAGRLLLEQSQIDALFKTGAWRVILHHARLSLMLGDHYYSSLAADAKWTSPLKLYANTERQQGKTVLKQKLDEHLVRVSEYGLKITQNLSRFATDMGVAHDVRSLKQKSPQGFEWQDKAVDTISSFRKRNENLAINRYGGFIVNMASTGCGKTIANAKIMRALSSDGKSLRYVLALGLRTLTLQTGDEYRDRIGLQSDELAVLIGSSAVKELHEQARQAAAKKDSDEENTLSNEDLGSESLNGLLDEDLNFDDAPSADFLDAIIPKNDSRKAKKNKAFLYAPVLACTIDHVIAATETKRGGKYILPCLRLLSSDLVIDEVDDFDGKDLIAIGRLIHLAGMLGRKVMISSATIPPALAEGFFNAYYEGWQLHSQFHATGAHSVSAKVACAWVDEFSSHMLFVEQDENQPNTPSHCGQYHQQHQRFALDRAKRLEQQPVRRKAIIVRYDDLPLAKAPPSVKECDVREQRYFTLMQQAALSLHEQHHTVDKKTGKKVSFGVIRVANIPPCVALTRFLLAADWPHDVMPKVMAYHSRQVLLLRSEQETHLDAVLKRKEIAGAQPVAFSDDIVRAHLDGTNANNVLFILVATSVEEVGRDHDFDWAVIEPSSQRSIVQMAGRVRRHRQTSVAQANIALMQYNLKALRQKNAPVFCRPGYERNSLKLETHDLCQLVDEVALSASVNAMPRIVMPDILQPKKRLADLEHQAIADSLTAYHQQGARDLQGWLTGCWWMTALPQQLNRFRDSRPDVVLHMIWREDEATLCERNDEGRFIKRQNIYGIKPAPPLRDVEQSRLWLMRNYEDALRRRCSPDEGWSDEALARALKMQSEKYGEITLPAPKDVSDSVEIQKFWYSDQFGLWPQK